MIYKASLIAVFALLCSTGCVDAQQVDPSTGERSNERKTITVDDNFRKRGDFSAHLVMAKIYIDDGSGVIAMRFIKKAQSILDEGIEIEESLLAEFKNLDESARSLRSQEYRMAANRYTSLSQFSEARASYINSIAILTGDVESHAIKKVEAKLDYAAFNFTIGDPNGARETLQAIDLQNLTSVPDNFRLRDATLNATVLMYENDFTGAIDTLEPVYNEFAQKDFADLYERQSFQSLINNLAAAYQNSGDLQRAMPLYAKLVANTYTGGAANPLDADGFYVNLASLLMADQRASPFVIFLLKKSANAIHIAEYFLGTIGERQRAAFRTSKRRYYGLLENWLSSSGRDVEAAAAGRLAIGTELSLLIGAYETQMPIPLTAAETALDVRLQQDPALLNQEQFFDTVYSFSETSVSESGLQIQSRRDVTDPYPDLPDHTALIQIWTSPLSTRFYVYLPESKFEYVERETDLREIIELVNQARQDLGTNVSNRSGRPVSNTSVASDLLDTQNTLGRLYELLFEPVDALLTDEEINHIVLQQSGGLRYLPFSALYDGEGYLIERFTFSRNTTGRIEAGDPVSAVQIAAFGVSEAVGDFNPLPYVNLELDELERLDGELDAFNIIWTDRNEAFSRPVLENTLMDDGDINVIHIASHFDLIPGSVDESGLLLGDGDTFTLQEFARGGQYNLTGVELVVLSACSTGTPTLGQGLEVEGFATLSRIAGADSVISTLWNVNDASTAAFMSDFYATWTSGQSKVAALQAAQLRMIRSSSEDSAHDFSHPLHWAPFILMGQWN